jgi:tripartite-type tricarboxylate transporter receptor subunit TctC
LIRSIFKVCLPFFLALVIIFPGEPAGAKYPAPGKAIEFIVPVGVGGGYDLYVRMLIPYLAKELGTKIRIRNEPRGLWLEGTKQIYTAKPDGYTIGIWNPGLLMNDRDILGKVDYDMTGFTFLFRITNEPRIVIVKKDGPVKDFNDLLAKGRSSGFKVRNAYAGGTGLLDAKLMDAEWKLNTEKIPYRSGNDGRMAVMRGDVHFCVNGLGAAPECLSSGRLKVILLLDDEPMAKVGEAQMLLRDFPELKSVPIPKDLGLPPLSYNTRSARAIIAPPGLPKDVRKTLEAALETIMKDKGLIEFGFKTDRPLGIGQKGDAYAARMKLDKQALLKIKHLLAD